MIVQQLEGGRCPVCLSEKAVIVNHTITCGHCGLVCDVTKARFCDRVPVFETVKKEEAYSVHGQLYEDGRGDFWKIAGYAQGCGRPVTGDYCTSCRGFFPKAVEQPRRRGKKSVREVEDGRMAAAGKEN